MYKVGELVLYGNHGVCKIIDIATRKSPSANGDQLYYTMKPLEQECTIYTPVDNPKVFIRPVISKAEAERLIGLIPSMHAEICHSSLPSELTEHYEASMKTHDCADLIKLTMSIYAKKQFMVEQKRKFGVVDERFMKRAEELLFGELSVALGVEKTQVSASIEQRLEVLRQESKKPSVCAAI